MDPNALVPGIGSRKTLVFCFAIITIGLVLRLVWPADMEWKGDEQEMYASAHSMARSGTWPAAGMKSGGGIVNPGMSVGVFALIATFTDDPVGMCQAVQWTNVLCVLGFLLFALIRIAPPERRVWLLGITLAAVNPLAVLFSRKIWAQDLMPAFALLIILGHNMRGRGWAAFLWGFAGALMGQVHMSGFFYAFGLFAVTALHDHVNGHHTRWIPWIAGSLLGAVALVPWILFMLQHPQPTSTNIWMVLQGNFWFYWFIDPLGLDLYYTLREEFWGFIREPVIDGTPTMLVALLHLVLVLAALVALRRILGHLKGAWSSIRAGWAWRASVKNMSVTDLHLASIFLGLGLFMSFSGATIYQHYLICTFPFTYIFIARILEGHRKLLGALMIAQLLITLGFLLHIHLHDGAPHGDYGRTFRAQIVSGL